MGVFGLDIHMTHLLVRVNSSSLCTDNGTVLSVGQQNFSRFIKQMLDIEQNIRIKSRK